MITYRVEREMLLKPFELNERIADVKSEIFRKGNTNERSRELKNLVKEQQEALYRVKETDSNYVYPKNVVVALMKAVEFQGFEKDEYLNALRALGVIAV